MNNRVFSVDLQGGYNDLLIVGLSQYDVGVVLEFDVFDGGAAAVFPSGTTATIQGVRPSGVGFNVACTLADNVVTVSSSTDMTGEAGKFPVEIRFTASGVDVGTVNFVFQIEKAAHPDGTIDADILHQQTFVEKVEAMETELEDIRTGSNGVEYDSAGDAVRGQIDDIKDAICNSDNLKRDILPFMQFGNYSVVGNNAIGYSLSANAQTYSMSSFVYAKNPIVFIKKPEAISAGLTCAVQIFRKQNDKYVDSTSMMSWFNATQTGGTSIEAGVYYWIGFRDGRNPHQLTKDKIKDYFEIFEVFGNVGYGQSSTTIAGFTGSAHVSIDIKTEYAETDLRVMSNDWTHMRVTYGKYPSDALFTAATQWEYSKYADFVIPAGTYYRLGIFRVDNNGTAIAQTEYRDLLEMRSAVVVGEADSVAIKFNPLYQNDQIDARGLTTLVANIAKRLAVVEASNDINVIPAYYQTHIADKATAINALRPADGSQFAFITDIHIGGYTNRGGNTLNAHALLNYLCEHTIINKVFNGGDLLNNNANYTIPDSIQKIRTAIGYAQPDTVANQFYIVGNHDGGLDYDGGGNITSPRHITPELLAVASGVYSVAMDVVYDPNSPFQFYYDNGTEGIRYIVLDIGERDNATDEGYLNSWRFFADALMSTPDGYHIVVFNHISGYSASTGEIAESYKQYIYDTLDAYKARQSYTLIGTETRNYAGAKGVVACVICGHSHEDFQGYTTGGIPWFVTTTDNAGGQFTNGVIGTGRPTGTTDEQAFDVFTVNKETKTINVTRIGYGADRTATY